MIFFSFSNTAFNKGYGSPLFEVVIASKLKYEDSLDFLNAALHFLSDNQDEDYIAEYSGIYLKDGDYRKIVEHLFLSMNQSIDVVFDEITKIQRIKCNNSSPIQENFLIQTKDEYIMFLGQWG